MEVSTAINRLSGTGPCSLASQLVQSGAVAELVNCLVSQLDRAASGTPAGEKLGEFLVGQG